MPEKLPVSIPVTACDHIALAVPDLEAALTLFRDQFGLTTGAPNYVPAQGIRIAYVDLGNVKLELMEPVNPGSPVGRYLKKRPAGGLHHICLETANARQAHTDIDAAGLSPVTDVAVGHHGRDLFFLDPKDTFGVLIEVESKETEQ